MKLSIVIPVYNSSSIIENLSSDILAVSKDLSKISDIELILVNDCSTDDTWLKISKISEKNKEKIIGINLMKNYGQHNAIMAGLKIAKGDYPMAPQKWQAANSSSAKLPRRKAKAGPPSVWAPAC